MVRRLPWVVSGSKVPAQQASSRPRRESTPSSSDDQPKAQVEPEVRSSPARTTRRKRARSRTTSSSPPPGPPGTEYMREGYDGDDIYIMVEDEFQSIAQSYTHHLHHAEYKRLQKKAREGPPKRIPESTADMSLGTKKKIESTVLHQLQEATLQSMTHSSELVVVDSDGSERLQISDPWSGTSLAGLMTLGSQKKTALVGLQKIPSSTRASRGFTRGEGDSPSRAKPAILIDIFGGKKRKLELTDEQSSSDLEDGRPDGPPPSRTTLSEEHKVGGRANGEAVHDVQGQGKSSVLRRSVIEDFDDFDRNQRELIKAQHDSKPVSNSLMKRKLAKENERKSRLSEIPTFLV